MAVSFNSSPSNFHIYAIVAPIDDEDGCIYIGKTRTTNLRKVLSYHRRKETLAATLFDSGAVPEIYLLETINTTNAIAYKHYIAWIRFFLENEYEPLCPLGVYEDAYELFPDTEEIYHGVSKHSITELLATPYAPPKVDRTPSVPSPPPTSSKISSRLSIRTKPEEHDVFVQFCNNNGFTQREGFVALLSLVTEKDFISTILQAQKDTIVTLKSQITKLSQLPRGIKADQRLKDLLSFYQSGIIRYIEHLVPNQQIQKPAPCHLWSNLPEILPNPKEYHYPHDSQFFLFRFEIMCYGHSHRNNAPIFLFGRDILHNTPILLRYYAKAYFVGVQPPYSPYFNRGTIFLMGCRVTDGVADLYAALPVSPSIDTTPKDAKIDVPRSFDDILSDAFNRANT